MDKMEKKNMMDKMVRELEDVTNSQTSLLKKLAQLEAENINLGNTILEKRLPDITSKIDGALTEANSLQEDFIEARDKFVKDNKLDEISPQAGS